MNWMTHNTNYSRGKSEFKCRIGPTEGMISYLPISIWRTSLQAAWGMKGKPTVLVHTELFYLRELGKDTHALS